MAWTPDGKHVGCGSADRNVYVWNYASTAIEYCLPGHKGSVNGIAFHPKEPIGTWCWQLRPASLVCPPQLSSPYPIP